MENQPLSSVYKCGAQDCAYISSLATNNSIAQNYYAKACGSLSNYLILSGGGNFSYSCASSCDPLQCTSGLWPITKQNIVDRIEASGRTWKAYMEDYPASPISPSSIGGCFLSDNAKYVAIHDPFVYFRDVENSSSRCSRIVRANTVATTLGPEADDLLLNDLQSPSTASNFMWLTPNNCDNMHDPCYGSSLVAEGNQYLSQLVPLILSSPLFKTQKAALFVTWDEGATTTPEQVAAIWAGPSAKPQYCNCTTTQFYSHASFPKTLETVWSLQSLNQQDTTAPAMMEFFK